MTCHVKVMPAEYRKTNKYREASIPFFRPGSDTGSDTEMTNPLLPMIVITDCQEQHIIFTHLALSRNIFLTELM